MLGGLSTWDANDVQRRITINFPSCDDRSWLDHILALNLHLRQARLACVRASSTDFRQRGALLGIN